MVVTVDSLLVAHDLGGEPVGVVIAFETSLVEDGIGPMRSRHGSFSPFLPIFCAGLPINNQSFATGVGITCQLGLPAGRLSAKESASLYYWNERTQARKYCSVLSRETSESLLLALAEPPL
jgi:hypothetical protein